MKAYARQVQNMLLVRFAALLNVFAAVGCGSPECVGSGYGPEIVVDAGIPDHRCEVPHNSADDNEIARVCPPSSSGFPLEGCRIGIDALRQPYLICTYASASPCPR